MHGKPKQYHKPLLYTHIHRAPRFSMLEKLINMYTTSCTYRSVSFFYGSTNTSFLRFSCPHALTDVLGQTDRYLMFYTQSTTKVRLYRDKTKCIANTSQIIHCLRQISLCMTVYDNIWITYTTAGLTSLR